MIKSDYLKEKYETQKKLQPPTENLRQITQKLERSYGPTSTCSPPLGYSAAVAGWPKASALSVRGPDPKTLNHEITGAQSRLGCNLFDPCDVSYHVVRKK